jgi:predicted alpha/beta-hydrolase family hydrolase
MLRRVSIHRLLLAPGASGGIDRLLPHARGLEARGVETRLLALPRGRAERALPAWRAALEDEAGRVAIGGHSFGGRVASLLAAERRPAALVLLSYPLHAPGRPEAWDDRTAHWPSIDCPVLLLSGESDPFATLPLLQRAVTRLADARLVTYPRIGHGLGPVLATALDEVAAFLESV